MNQRRHYAGDFAERRRWPVGLIAGLLVMFTLSHAIAIHAGVQLGLGIAAEAARVEAAKPKRVADRPQPVPLIDCSPQSLAEMRSACYLRARSELIKQK